MRSDLTARALIRNAALRLFADHGPETVSVRQIAAYAEVSPGLVLHHYGNKAGLREAVDAYAETVFDDLLDVDSSTNMARALAAQQDFGSVGELFARAFPAESPLPAYLRRLLLSGDPAGERLFRRWYDATATFLQAMSDEGLLRTSHDPNVLAAFLLVNDFALVLLRSQVGNVVGFDPLTPDGMDRWANQVLQVYRHGLLASSAETADAAGTTDAADTHTRDTTERE